MLGLIGKIFGTEKSLSKTVETIGNVADKFVYTKQERAQAAIDAVKMQYDYTIRWMEATQGQNLSRRIIAMTITFIWAIEYVAMVSLSVAAVWVSNPDKILQTVSAIESYATQTNNIFAIVLGFYFVARPAEKYIDKIGGKKHAAQDNAHDR